MLIGGPFVGGSVDADHANSFGQLGGERGNLAGAQAQAMLGLHAGRGGRALDGIEAVHAVFRLLAAVGVIANQFVEAGVGGAGEEIGVEGDDDVGLAQVVLDVQPIFKEGSSDCRLVLHQGGLGIRGLHCLPLARQGGRSNARAQKIDAGAVLGRSNFHAEGFSKFCPRAALALEENML